MTARLKEGSAVGMLCCGLALAFTALLLPPSGEIHESVLYLFAQILIYCGSVFGNVSVIYCNYDKSKNTWNYVVQNTYLPSCNRFYCCCCNCF